MGAMQLKRSHFFSISQVRVVPYTGAAPILTQRVGFKSDNEGSGTGCKTHSQLYGCVRFSNELI